MTVTVITGQIPPPDQVYPSGLLEISSSTIKNEGYKRPLLVTKQIISIDALLCFNYFPFFAPEFSTKWESTEIITMATMRNSITIIALILVATSGFAQSKKVLISQVEALKKEVDSLKGANELLLHPKELELPDTLTKASYGLGLLMGTNLRSQGGDSLDVKALADGIKDVYLEKTPKLSQEEALPIVQLYMQRAVQRKRSELIEQNAAFLEQNQSKEGVVTTDTGLQYKIISSGSGKAPLPTDKVTVHYVGKLIDGTVFDSSEGGDPVTLDVDGVIPGWTEALQLMHEGDKWELFIPFPLGYGERGAGEQVPPYSTLIFEVELIKVN